MRCRRCARLQRQFRKLRQSHPDYWNQPVPPTTTTGPALTIVGLAPGMHGANQTGRAFTGDASGELLFRVLEQIGIADRVIITNAVKCLPVQNLPTSAELNNCQRFLKQELAPGQTVLALGGMAHKAVLKTQGVVQARYPFGHGSIHDLGTMTLVDSYHCSRYNTQTGRLTEPMFRAVVESAADMAGITAR